MNIASNLTDVPWNILYFDGVRYSNIARHILQDVKDLAFLLCEFFFRL